MSELVVDRSNGVNDVKRMSAQLERAVDGREMLVLFRQHLRTFADREYEIEHCHLSRIRNRDAVRAVLQYSLQLLDLKTGARKRQTVTGTIYADKNASHIVRKLINRDVQIPESLRTFHPVCAIADLNMLVQVFPYDRRLVALRSVAADLPAEFRSAIESQQDGGPWEIVQCRAESVRYRAGLAAVIRYVVCLRNVNNQYCRVKTFYAKVFREPADGERACRILAGLHGQDSLSFQIGKPVGYSSQIGTLLLAAADGTTLEELLLNGSASVRIGEFAARLAAFHQGTPPTHRLHTADDQLSNLERSARRLRWACPELRQEINAITSCLRRPPDVTPGPTHRDLKPEHILFAGRHVSLIDWDSFASADPILDTAMLVARLTAMPWRHDLPPASFRRVSDEFCREYFAHVPPAWKNRFRDHLAGALLEVAVGFFGRQEPRWRATVSALVRESRAISCS